MYICDAQALSKFFIAFISYFQNVNFTIAHLVSSILSIAPSTTPISFILMVSFLFFFFLLFLFTNQLHTQ